MSRADDAALPQLATATDYRAAAIASLRKGDFSQTQALITKASEMSHDATTEQMFAWWQTFETLRSKFAAERHKQHDDRVERREKAGGRASTTRWRSTRFVRRMWWRMIRPKFVAEPWVQSLIGDTAKIAEKAEADNDWLKSQWLYADLVAVQPGKVGVERPA